MKFYLDTEFIERGHQHPIELISIGIVAENGDELYAVLLDGWDASHASDWVRENVLRNIGDAPRVPRADVANRIRSFVAERSADSKPEFWGYYADYDWVIFCQLFGAVIDLPKGWPMFCRDVIQVCKEMGNPELPKQTGCEHNALADARHIREMHLFLRPADGETTLPALGAP